MIPHHNTTLPIITPNYLKYLLTEWCGMVEDGEVDTELAPEISFRKSIQDRRAHALSVVKWCDQVLATLDRRPTDADPVQPEKPSPNARTPVTNEDAIRLTAPTLVVFTKGQLWGEIRKRFPTLNSRLRGLERPINDFRKTGEIIVEKPNVGNKVAMQYRWVGKNAL